MINFDNLIAASVNLDIDYKKMTDELMKLLGHKNCIKFSYPTDNGTEVTAYSIFLRKCEKKLTEVNFRTAKSVDYDNWDWDYDIDIPYTRDIIESIPFTKLGTVRIVFFPNVPCIEHTDWDDNSDTKHTLGLSIIPNTGNTHCNVWHESRQEYVSIPGNAMLLNDSFKHWVPTSEGTRITMRLFGEIDYSWFNDKIDYDLCYY